MTTTTRTLYTPPDAEAAFEAWGCNCGPASLAALLGLKCEGVRDAFPDFAKRHYANPTHVLAALEKLGVRARSIGPHRPVVGLAFIQWGGPWLQPGVPVGAAYQRTHWIAVDGEAVYDVNAQGWVSRETWEDPTEGVAAYLMEHVKGCDGTWSIRAGIEVRL